MKKTVIYMLVSVIIILTASVPVFAETGELALQSRSVILIEPNTGTVIYEKNSDESLPPASVTKIMSLLLTVEALERGDITLDTVVTASETASAKGGSQIWLEPGEEMTVNDLLKAVCVVSANDGTTALAELISGSEESFTVLMNERAKELGMNNTVFKNCTGLDAEGHLTTAYDISLMSAELIKHDIIKNYTTIWMDTLRDGKSELVNTNRLIRFYEGATGLKTGTTSSAGYCLSATAERDGVELVAVVMAAPTSNDRFSDAQKLLNYGFANYSYVTVHSDIGEDARVSVKNGQENYVSVIEKEPFTALLKKSDAKRITLSTSLPEYVESGICEGDVIGTTTVLLDGEVLGEIELVAANSVGKKSIWYFASVIASFLLTL